MIRRKLVRERPPGGGLYFSSPKVNIKFIRTGCTMLDCVLGGGWPLGRVVNLVGDKSTGKTLLAMEAVANIFLEYDNAQVWYNEAEAAFDSEYADALGIPIQRVTMIENCSTIEELFNDVDQIVKKARTAPGLYIIDSLDALSDEAEMGRGIDEASYGGAKAKKLSEFFRRITKDIKKSNICLLIISQVRDNIGAMFGEKHTRSGGKALDFYASQVLWLAHMGILKRTVNKVERPVGVKIRARCKKNKVGLPFRDCDFEISFGFGVEDDKASLEFLKSIGVQAKPSGDELRKLVIENWYKIEKTFLPTRRKYGTAP